MAIDTNSLTCLIPDFRRFQTKDSITSESPDTISQCIAGTLATAGTYDTVEKIQKLIDGFNTVG